MRSWTIVKRRSIFSMLATYWLQVQPQAIRTLLIDIFLLPQEYLFEIPLRNNSLRKNVKQFARRTESREKGGGNILFHWLLQTLSLVLHLFWFSISLDSRERERERKSACSLLNRGPRLFLVRTERLATCRVPRLNNASVTWSIRPASSVVNHLEEERESSWWMMPRWIRRTLPEPPVSPTLVITAVNPPPEISCLTVDWLLNGSSREGVVTVTVTVTVVACER